MSATLARDKLEAMQAQLPEEVGMHLAELLSVQAEVMPLVESELLKTLDGNTGLAADALAELLGAGGKRIRPLLSILATLAVGGRSEDAIPLAVAVELLHSASLLHDDVLDEGELRRGIQTARARHGNKVAVLAGDYGFFAAINVLLAGGHVDLLPRCTSVARDLIEGELLQLEIRQGQRELDVDGYWAIVRRKTASLLAFAAWGGAKVAGAAPPVCAGFAEYGLHLGLAFQVIDDVLDMTGAVDELGKEVGQDKACGQPTLPVLIPGGVEESRLMAGNLIKTAVAALSALPRSTSVRLLVALAGEVHRRGL